MRNIKLLLLFIFLFPILVKGAGVKGIINAGYDIIVSVLIPLAFGLCLMYFFWGVAKYIKSIGSEKDEGKQVMVWGILALFIVSSIWGIISFIRTELQIPDIQNVERES